MAIILGSEGSHESEMEKKLRGRKMTKSIAPMSIAKGATRKDNNG